MSRKRRAKLIVIGGLLGASLAGCGSSSKSYVFTQDTPPQGPAFIIHTDDLALSRNGDIVNTIELEAFDADGKPLLFGTGVLGQTALEDHDDADSPVRPLSKQTVFPPLPAGTASIEVDYLRNGGFTLYQAKANVTADQSSISGLQPTAVDAPKTKWSVITKDDGKFQVRVSKHLAGKADTESDFVIKGVCYSPTPINVLGDGAPNIGDFFFDSSVNPSGVTTFFNWYGLWGFGSLGDGYYAREDLKKIRNLKANTIRVYSMLSRQQNDLATHPKLPEFPDPLTQEHRTHKQFLDACWNNGDDPLYVIVGIPIPAELIYQSLQLSGTAAKRDFYDHVLRETIADLKDHPAVLGFTLQNELNNGVEAFPNGHGGQMTADQPLTGAQNAASDFYWGKIKEHSDYSKTTAPDKLNGVVFHDFREVAQYASSFPTSGGTYLERAENLDFVGVNTYQTVNYNDQYVNGWGGIQGPGRKPMLFAELGFPATTRDESGDPATIKETPESRANTAAAIRRMLPQAYSNEVSIGACYFEFSDEWWKQISNTKQIQVGNETKTVRATDQWYGGNRDDGFPNKYWDEEGFGLYSIARFPGLKNSDPVMVNVGGHDIGPDRRLDRLTERTEITKVVREIFGSL